MINFSAISWQEQVTFEEIMMMSDLHLHLTNTLIRIFIVLAH